MCCSSFINEDEFPRWLQNRARRSPKFDGSNAAGEKLLEGTYVNRQDLRRIFPHVQYKNLPQQPSQQQGASSEGPGHLRMLQEPPLGQQQQREDHFHNLSNECHEVLAFIQDSLLEFQQHGTKHLQVKHGFKSLVVKRQDPESQRTSTDESGTEPYFGKDYVVKSIIVSASLFLPVISRK